MTEYGSVKHLVSRSNLRRRYRRDFGVLALIVLMVLVVIVPLLLIVGHVIVSGIGALNLEFFTNDLGSPTRALLDKPSGLGHSIIGTLVVDIAALLLAIPIGIAAGIMLSEYRENPLTPLLRVLNDTLNGMPAILKGMLAWTIIVRPAGTFSGWAGAVALSFVMIPIIARATEGVLSVIPWDIREAGLALGLPRWRVVLSAVLPAARTGVVTGVLLAFARAVGEAAPLLLTALGNNFYSNNILEYLTKPVDTLPSRLYSLAMSPYEQWHGMGWAAGIVLLGIVVVAFILARAITSRNRFAGKVGS